MKLIKQLKKHKLIATLLLIFFLFIIGIGSYFIFKVTLKKEDKKNIYLVTLRDIEVDLFGKEPKVDDYIVSLKNSSNNKNIDYDRDDFKIEYLNDKKKAVSLSISEVKIFYVQIYSKKYNVDQLVKLNVVDKEAPSLEVKDVTIKEGEKYQANNFVASCSDNSKKDCIISFKEETNFSLPGGYSVFIVAEDESGNIVEKEAKLIIKDVPKEKNNEAKTSKGYKIVTTNGVTTINGILIVNKTYSLPSNYGDGLTKEMMNKYNQMKQDASNEGIELKIVSGYRSYYDQKVIYNNYVNRDGMEEADTYSARPGHSEHQSGLAFDLNWIDTAFKDTKEGKWLNDNAYKYGFVLRYPEGKTNETGYIFEPWHYRYVGSDLASKLYNGGMWITIENYFGITSNY